MGAKDSKPSCISYEDAIKRGEWKIQCFVLCAVFLLVQDYGRPQTNHPTAQVKKIAFDLIIQVENIV